MSVALPERVDASRMVQARRTFQGQLPLASLERLRESLATSDGVADYDLEFGRDELGIAYLAVRVDAELPLTCQRTLEVFRQPVHVDQRLGLVHDESEEAALPPGYEPLLIADGEIGDSELVLPELEIVTRLALDIRTVFDNSQASAQPLERCDRQLAFEGAPRLHHARRFHAFGQGD